MSEGKPLRILVASAVYGLEHLLDQVFSTLEGYGYEVWMSHKGTIPTDPRLSNFENCLLAVDACDLFLGVITGRYGSGQTAAPPRFSTKRSDERFRQISCVGFSCITT